MGQVGGGANDPYFLNTDPGEPPLTVFNDGDEDELKGGSGSDWLLANSVEDEIKGLKAEDTFTDFI